MNIRYYLLIGLVLTELGITVCRGEKLCPNEPVTPYPIPGTTENCPNQPIPAYHIKTQAPPIVSFPTNPWPLPTSNPPCSYPCPVIQTNPPPTYNCINQPTSNPPCSYPCPVIQTNPPPTYNCINQPTSNPPCSYPCPVIQTNPPPTYNCINQPTSNPPCSYPYPVIQTNPPPTYNCINQPGYATNPCSSSTTPCDSTTSNCGSTNNCCGQRQCCQTEHPHETTPPPTYEPRPTIPTPPPETLIKCPSGTQLIGKECHLIYCPRGSQMVNDRCVVIECPEGTVWTGHRCSVPEPIVQNLTFYNTVTTQFNLTKPDIILNNTYNFVVNASLTIPDENNNSKECNNDCENGNSTTTSPTNVECCEVMTPRICKYHNNRWRCYSRRSRRCGDFCVAPIIYLKTSRVYARPQYVVMPPIQNDCQSYGNCGPLRDGHDCSGCAMNYMDRCSHYCYRYSCPTRRCDFYDQKKYCAHNTGSYGCQEEDGCFDDWCL